MAKHYPGVQVKPLEGDPHPQYYCDLVRLPDGSAEVSHAMAFDPYHGPDSQAQIDFWRDRGYPRADEWEIGKPIPKVGDATARDAMERRAHQLGRRLT